MFTLKDNKLVPCLVIALHIFVLDQVSKALVMASLTDHKPIPILPNLNFILEYNKGAAFGMLADSGGWQRWLFVVIAVAISALILAWSTRLKNKDTWEGVALGCILGGALGNLADRIFYGHVIDVIDFYIGQWHWYTFNIADITICEGALILAYLSFSRKR